MEGTQSERNQLNLPNVNLHQFPLSLASHEFPIKVSPHFWWMWGWGGAGADARCTQRWRPFPQTVLSRFFRDESSSATSKREKENRQKSPALTSR